MFKRQIFEVLDKVVYLILTIVGAYFIIQGEVVPRYVQRRTNFYQYEEDISELPTITTFMDPIDIDSSLVQLGRDFNISFQGVTSTEMTNLTIGINWMENDVQVEMEQLAGANIFLIRPIKSPMSGSLTDKILTLTYTFKHGMETKFSPEHVILLLATENNSVQYGFDKYKDGNIIAVISKLGRRNDISIKPEKYLFLQELKECRNKPFNELLFERV